MNCSVEDIRALWLPLCMLSSSFFLAIQHIFLLSSTIHGAQKENKYCHHWKLSAVTKLQAFIFEEVLIREEMCFIVSLKQLLKSIFLKVWICARVSRLQSRLPPPHFTLCPVLVQGAEGAGCDLPTTFPTSTDTLDCSSHTAQGVETWDWFTGLFFKAEI